MPMKSCILSVIAILLSSLLFAQSPDRKIIPGTKCSMEVKEGFRLARRFKGLEHKSGNASIMVSVLPSPVEKNVNAFTGEEMKRRGMIFIDKSSQEVNGIKATYFEATQVNKGVNFRKYILVFGDTAKTVFINSIAPDSNLALRNAVKEMIFSVNYDPALTEDLVESLPFRLDVQPTGLKVARSSVSGVIYTRDGKVPTLDPDSLVFSAGVAFKKLASPARKEYAMKRFNSLTDIYTVTKQVITEVITDSLPGYLVDGVVLNKSGKEEVVLMMILFDKNDQYYLLAGRAKQHFNESRKLFKSIMGGFIKTATE